MGQNPPSIPGFFGACNNPVTLGATSSMSDPDKNITGVTYYLSAEKQFDIYKKLFPKMTSVGILLEKGHPGAAIDSKDTKDAAAKFGFKYTDVTVSTPEELASGVKTLKDKGADIIIIGSMGMIIDGTDKVIQPPELRRLSVTLKNLLKMGRWQGLFQATQNSANFLPSLWRMSSMEKA